MGILGSISEKQMPQGQGGEQRKVTGGTNAPQEEDSHPASLDVDRHQDRIDKIVSNAILTIRKVHGKTLDLRACLSSVDIFIIRIIAKKIETFTLHISCDDLIRRHQHFCTGHGLQTLPVQYSRLRSQHQDGQHQRWWL
jgi:hypothetical protein